MKKGFTLLELISSIFIVTLLGGVLIWVILNTKILVDSTKSRAAARQEMQVIVFRITKEMQDSTSSSFVSGSNAFAFASAVDENGIFVTDSSGKPVWQKYILYYIPSGKTSLLKKEIDYGTFNPSSLSSYCDGSGTRISSSVTSITLTIDKQKRTGEINLTVEQKNKMNKVNRITYYGKLIIFN